MPVNTDLRIYRTLILLENYILQHILFPLDSISNLNSTRSNNVKVIIWNNVNYKYVNLRFSVTLPGFK